MNNEKGKRQVKRITPPSAAKDENELALAESLAIEEGRLKAKALKSEHSRKEVLRNFFLYAASIFIIAGILIMLAIVITWAVHLLAPDEFHWLTQEQISELQKVLSGSLIAVIASDYIKKYL